MAAHRVNAYRLCVVLAAHSSSFSFASSTTNARSFFQLKFINSVHTAKRIHSVIASLCTWIVYRSKLRFSFKQVERIAGAILNNGQIEIYTNAFQITLIANKGHWPRWCTTILILQYPNKWKLSPIILFAMNHWGTHRPNRINILSDELHTLRSMLTGFVLLARKVKRTKMKEKIINDSDKTASRFHWVCLCVSAS